MSLVLQVGEQYLEGENIVNLLAGYQMLPQLAREILIDQAIKEIQCTEEEGKLARQRFYQQQQILSEEHLEAWRSQHYMSVEQLEQRIVRDLKIEKFKQDTWGNKVESYFLQRKGQLDRVVYSLIRTQDAGIAQELYFRIHEGENTFAELAKEYSQGSEAQTGGLVGPVELNIPHPAIAQMLKGAKSGELLPPKRIENWIVIIRLEKFISAELDQVMTHRLIDEMFRNWLQEKMQQQITVTDVELEQTK